MTGVVFVLSSLYLTLVVSVVYTLNERGFSQGMVYHTGRRWGKFLLLLVGLGVATQLLTIL
jgi:hypothetical protein